MAKSIVFVSIGPALLWTRGVSRLATLRLLQCGAAGAVMVTIAVFDWQARAAPINSTDEIQCRVATAQKFMRGMGKEPDRIEFTAAAPGSVTRLPMGGDNVDPLIIMTAIDSREYLFGFTAIERVRHLEESGQRIKARETAEELVRDRVGPVVWLSGTLQAKVAGKTTRWSVRCPVRQGRVLDLWIEIGN